MALAGTRNAKALAWNNGSLDREARAAGMGSGVGKDTETGEMGKEWCQEEETESHPEAETQMDKGQGRPERSHCSPRQDY